MPHVSKTRIDVELQAKMQGELFEILTVKQNRKGQMPLLEILSPTELLMLSKRLAVIFMLSEGESRYMITKTLGVSVSTSARLHENLRRKRYRTILKLFNNKKKRQGFWNILELILQAGMPPRGKGRWSFLDE